MIKEEIICAGHGGQGIVSMGKFLAYVGMNAGYNVTWIPSYGAEVRGGTAHSMVRIQKDKIADPTVTRPTSCIVMNKPSLLKFVSKVKIGGLLLVDDSQIDIIPERKNIVIKKAAFTKIAMELGDRRVANMLAIAAFNKMKNLFSLDELIKSLSFVFHNKKELIPVNEKALREGDKLV